ncbi:hypothetical protein [Algoriphagus mannitolivorans]|uniref:hypothetical protein n=1 Tax=Algoriphagus mannitolivorans TaxID=226504 RepID=UPI001B7F7D2D|nr:hypothetical protein [Algoriphagus mannitolivorans]
MINQLKYLLVLLAVAFLGGCQENPDPSSEEIQQIKTQMASGQWVISKFIDSGKDETSDFAGFVFVFNSSGVLSAKKGSLEYIGTWSITNSSGKNNSQGNDDSQDDLDFNIFFNLTNEFEDLNDDWDILTHTSTKIELTDVSGGDGSVDYLTFIKN